MARGLNVRPFEPRDVAAVLDLEQATPEAAHWPRAEYEQLAGSSPLALVAEGNEGEIVGFLIARRVSDEVEILNLAVRSELRRKGIGSSLLSRLLQELDAERARKIYLEVRRSNNAAIAFYQRQGFARVGERRNYYRDPIEDALVLSLSVVEKI